MNEVITDGYRRIEEDVIEGMRLGRHINHDIRSWAYRIFGEPAAAAVTKDWTRHIDILDQGSLGSCTGNASVGALGCSPHYEELQPMIGGGTLTLNEGEAVNLYSQATVLDPYSGQYPPDDTGSDGLSVAKAVQNALLINGYQHAMSVADMVTAMQTAPVIIGINWFTSFDTPDKKTGEITIAKGATVRGGHELCIRKVDVDAETFTGVQSWGPGWGNEGEFVMSFATMAQLFAKQGDATLFTPLSHPPPTPGPIPPTPGALPADAADVAFRAAATKATVASRPFKTWEAKKTWQ